jgi:hypothetical protein
MQCSSEEMSSCTCDARVHGVSLFCRRGKGEGWQQGFVHCFLVCTPHTLLGVQGSYQVLMVASEFDTGVLL